MEKLKLWHLWCGTDGPAVIGKRVAVEENK